MPTGPLERRNRADSGASVLASAAVPSEPARSSGLGPARLLATVRLARAILQAAHKVPAIACGYLVSNGRGNHSAEQPGPEPIAQHALADVHYRRRAILSRTRRATMRTRAMAILLGIAVAFTGFSATTASAYDNSDLSISSWNYNTSDCPCSNSSGLDYTSFREDPGGNALKLVVENNGTAVAQVEFHPYDEVVYVYDGKNDGDTIYVRVQWWEGLKKEATYWAPGTSAELDVNRIEMGKDNDLDEGETVYFRLYDDKELTDPITDWYDYIGHA